MTYSELHKARQEQFDEKFSDKEGCQAGNPECGKKAEVSGQYLCSSCEKWGGRDGEPKDHKRPMATSKQIKSFSTQTFLQIAEEEIKRLEGEKRGEIVMSNMDLETDGWNAALDSQISYWKEQIIGIKEER